jgi:ankyrin repeat protein
MHYAAVQNNNKCLELILAKGASLSIINEDGLTPLDMSSPEFRAYFQKSQKSSPRASQARPVGNSSPR